MALTEWMKLQVAKDVCSAYWKRPEVRALKDWSDCRERDTARSRLQSIRADTRRAFHQLLQDREALAIRTAINALIEKSRERTHVMAAIGKGEPFLKKPKRGEISIRVGFMWNRNVNNKTYKKGFVDASIFILTATEVRINSRQFGLFKVKTGNLDTAEMREGYLAFYDEPSGKKRHFALRWTASAAMNAIADVVSELVDTKLIRENDNDTA